MQSAYEKFLEIKWKIEDEETWLKAVFSDIQNMQKKSIILNKDIQSFRDDSNSLLEDIKSNKESSDSLKLQIESTFKTSKDTTNANIEEIKKITALITDTGFANSFHTQSKKLNKSLIFWWLVIILSLVGLSFLLYKLFTDTANNETNLLSLEIWMILYRLSLTSPLLFLIGFSMNQYGRVSNLNNKYQFKATIASSISHHIIFLKDEFDNEVNIWEFAKEIFTKIYKEPYKINDDKKIKNIQEKLDNLSKNTKELKKQDFDIDKILKSTKELKDLFPNEAILTKVIEFLNKLVLKQ